MRSDLFDYHLPQHLIAQRPPATRGDSRLMVVHRASGTISDHGFGELLDYLEAGDCLVLNDTRVRKARLAGIKEGTEARIELLLLRPLEDDLWEALARPARRIRREAVIRVGDNLAFRVEEKGEDGQVLLRSSTGLDAVEEAVERYGLTPTPPYIKEEVQEPERYQTVYAQRLGSAAAPTAGLHFSPEALERVRAAGVSIASVRLDIGLDTFRPLTEENIEDHVIHREEMEVTAGACAAINEARTAGGRIVAVGTTSVRALETAAGESGELSPCAGPTALYITPGYRFKAVDALLTNFHLPRSTLLLLVSAFAGHETIMRAYRAAIGSGYRFYSFGDAMLIL